ncbi:hypothetical protein BTN50_1182 [Candidatus Enterovibrio altilux]|uniref:Mobile element protein n=1 Tax=Candidatus Enterovibrio altilux TaxID=1927128 RepID=A0A291B9J6_9GAMM|nr:hypothetical protein BTN50_1182 [Candidatus Enterovibrio luxaltus]
MFNYCFYTLTTYALASEPKWLNVEFKTQIKGTIEHRTSDFTGLQSTVMANSK